MDYKKEIFKKGLKKTFVADQIGISNVELSYYINGRRKMPDQVKEKLESYLSN